LLESSGGRSSDVERAEDVGDAEEPAEEVEHVEGDENDAGMTVPDRCRLIDRTGLATVAPIDQLLGMRHPVSRVGRDHQTGFRSICIPPAYAVD